MSLNQVPTGKDVPNDFNVIIEIPMQGDPVKYEVDKLPWLGDIPGLGWLLGSESPTTKKSQLVAVIECTPLMPETKVMAMVKREIDEMTEKVVSAGERFNANEIGFDQYLFDNEKKGIDPLP